MKRLSFLFVSLALSTIAVAQPGIPLGTILPISLDSSLDSHRSKPGQKVIGRIEQDVPLPNGSRLKARTRVMGEVIAVTQARGAQPADMTLRFYQVDTPGHTIPISTNLRAIASPIDVDAAEFQSSGAERGDLPPWAQNTVQIGGDVVYREPGIVERRGERVGESVYAGNWGVLAHVDSGPGTECRSAVASNDSPQALWVFSHDACGVYGLDLVIKDPGRPNPEGQFVLESTKGDLKLRFGTGLLLRVNGT